MNIGRALTWLPAIGLIILIPAFLGAWRIIPWFLAVSIGSALTAYADAWRTRVLEEDAEDERVNAAEQARWERLDGAYRLTAEDEPEPEETNDPAPTRRDIWRCAAERTGDFFAFIGLYVILAAEAMWDAAAASLTTVGAALAPATTRYGGLHRVLNEQTTLLETVPGPEPDEVDDEVAPTLLQVGSNEPGPTALDEPTVPMVAAADLPLLKQRKDWEFDTAEHQLHWDRFFDEQEAANVRA